MNFKLDATDSHKFRIPLGKFTETFSTDDEDEQFTEDLGTTPFDQMGHASFQHYIAPHETAEDVTIVAAQAGSEDTNWIFEFCDD